eukprot:3352826-Pyramimonas_sp.AAC.1
MRNVREEKLCKDTGMRDYFRGLVGDISGAACGKKLLQDLIVSGLGQWGIDQAGAFHSRTSYTDA